MITLFFAKHRRHDSENRTAAIRLSPYRHADTPRNLDDAARREDDAEPGEIRFVFCTDPHFEHATEEHLIEGVAVPIYTPAKTIAKYRGKIGLNVAIEALRKCWRAKRFTMNELWADAMVCRV